MNKHNHKFFFDWILINKLAIGNSPTKEENLILLKQKKVRNILGLCSEKEIIWHKDLENNFCCQRIYIPDSNSQKLPSFEELITILNLLEDFINNGITFLHCYASIERSPMVCIIYMMKEYNLSRAFLCLNL